MQREKSGLSLKSNWQKKATVDVLWTAFKLDWNKNKKKIWIDAKKKDFQEFEANIEKAKFPINSFN